MKSWFTRTVLLPWLAHSICTPSGSSNSCEVSVYVTVPEVQSAAITAIPATAGVINSQLNTLYQETPVANVPISSQASSVLRDIPSEATLEPAVQPMIMALRPDIFVPISTTRPLPQFPQKPNHPNQGIGIVKNSRRPFQTNKFYANFLLGSQRSTVFTFPYGIAFTGLGMSVSHTTKDQMVFDTAANPPKYYINPLFIRSIILSATNLARGTTLVTDSQEAFSIRVMLSPNSASIPSVIFPVVQGMGFVTALYAGAQPKILSEVFFRNLVYVGPTAFQTTYKYRAYLEDSTIWMIYLTPSIAPNTPPVLTLMNSTCILGPSSYKGSIQVSKIAEAEDESVYDQSAGVYSLSTKVSGSVTGNSGSYTFTWQPGGLTNRNILMFALPHHVNSIEQSSAPNLQSLKLQTTTKGISTAYLGNTITLIEANLPINLAFDPLRQDGSGFSFNPTIQRAIANASRWEISQDISAFTIDPTSMYWQGKGLARYAMTVYSTHAYAKDSTTAAFGLNKLKTAFQKFVDNQQQVPLVYDAYWGGITTSASYTQDDAGLDYGATYYNDHHFHYGYFVYTAAVIGFLDPDWINQGTNKAWVNDLIRDYSNSVKDSYTPFSRAFDWWHGHSWATGLFESADGKNEESTSEDGFSLYAIKIWGKVIGDTNMEARGNLQMAILKRTLNSYFLMEASNTNQPSQFIPNKQAGITFENKCDHATFFGLNPEYIAGIHQLPINAASAYLRNTRFVFEEWNTYFSRGRVDQVEGSTWKNVLYANWALVNPIGSWSYFSSPQFNPAGLDNGASWAWYLAFSAAMGGAKQYDNKP